LVKRSDQAAMHFRAALQRQPDFIAAHYHLAAAMAQSGREDEKALEHLKTAVQQAKSAGGISTGPHPMMSPLFRTLIRFTLSQELLNTDELLEGLRSRQSVAVRQMIGS